MRSLRLVLPLVVLVALPSPALASGLPYREPAGSTAPNVLPATGATAARLQPSTWLVGARPGARTDAIAARFGAERLSPRGIYRVTRGRARAFAAALRAGGRYRFAEPNRELQPAQAPAGGDEFAATEWRTFLVPAGLTPPPLAQAPLTAVIDGAADPAIPDLAGVQVIRNTAVTDLHGSAVASVIGGRANGVGMVGVYPGAPILSIGTDLTTADVIKCLAAAEAAHARVLNMSYGAPQYSYAEDVELAYAYTQGIVPVAAAGNDRDTQLPDGTTNPVMYPAALPHVVSVAAMGPSGATSSFSTSNGAVDLAAPGESVLTAVPPAFDDDGVKDGYERLDGTSFASPIVAGVAAWLTAARPDLSNGQIADLMRFTAADIGARGWDEDSGYGVVNLREALTAAAPAPDALEVNDNIDWVDGRRFSKPDPFFFRARDRKRALDATVDYWKDYADVYRVQLGPRRRLKLRLTMPRGTNPDLAVFSKRAKTIYKKRGMLGWSYNKAGRTERITVRNGARRTKVVYAVVYSPTRKDARYDAPYRLTIKR
ncbi:MAG TPA: S8 family serine peptidase [Solirubrobacteraceae bacterium]|nr:S8 family serine peptidase [Solirubrobacteraceae bacterium]